VRFMPVFYAPLNYLVNGTIGAPSFLSACMAFPRDLLTPLYPTGSFLKPTVPVNGEAPAKEREKRGKEWNSQIERKRDRGIPTDRICRQK